MDYRYLLESIKVVFISLCLSLLQKYSFLKEKIQFTYTLCKSKYIYNNPKENKIFLITVFNYYIPHFYYLIHR